MGGRGIATRGSSRDIKSGQGFQIKGKRYQIGAKEITNSSITYHKSGQGL